MTGSHSQFIAAGLRTTALALRFGILFFVAKFLSPTNAGYFTLYYVAVQLASSILTLDVYAEVTRMLISRTQNAKDLVGFQIGVIIIASVFGAPLSLILYYFSSDAVPMALIFLFIPQVISEIFLNDLGRLLVPLARPFSTTVLTFLRSALWALPILFFMILGNSDDTLELFCYTWIFASIVSSCYALWSIYGAIDGWPKLTIDITSILSAVKYSMTFLIGSLLLRVIMGVDRFFVESTLGIELVAVYGTFVAVAFSQSSLLETGVSAWHFPKMAQAISKNDQAEFKRIWKLFVWQNTISSIALTVTISITFSFLTLHLLPSVYFENIRSFYIIMIGMFLYSVSIPFYYVVYSFRKDLSRVLSFAVGATIMICIAIYALPEMGLEGAGIMNLSAFAAVSVFRVVHAIFLLNEWSLSHLKEGDFR